MTRVAGYADELPMRGIVLDALARLIAACGGTLRQDIDGLDILTVLNGISLASLDASQTGRLIDLVLRGLRAATV